MHWIDALGYFGALLTIGTYSMKTMIPLRIIGILDYPDISARFGRTAAMKR